MTETTLALLFYFAVFAGLVGAVAYLFVTKPKSQEEPGPVAEPVAQDSQPEQPQPAIADELPTNCR